MYTNGSIYNKRNHRVKHYKTRACKGCAVRQLCTQNKNGRFIERGIYQEELEQNAARVAAHPQYYRQRQQITEHQFGTLKRQWGFTHTLLRKKEHVLSEVYLCFSAYNLLRSLQILGKKELQKRLKALYLVFNTDIGRIKALVRPCFQREYEDPFLRLCRLILAKCQLNQQVKPILY